MGRVVISGPVLKPKSTDVGKSSRGGRLIDTVQRNLSQDPWPNRWLWLEESGGDVLLRYAEHEGGGALKSLRVSEVVSVHALDQRHALKEGMPQMTLLDHCFAVLTESRRLVFACLDGKREQWVAALRAYNVSAVSDEVNSDCEEVSSEDPSELHDDSDDDLGSAEENEEDEEDEETEESEKEPGSPFSPYDQALAERPKVYLPEPKLNVIHGVAKGQTILFAAQVTKISSKDKDQDRILALTDTSLFLVEEGRLKLSKTRIPTHEVSGLIRNIHDDLQLAVLWSTGHDYLLSFLSADTGAVESFIAHLAKAHEQAAESTGTLMVRESNNILTAIRRSESDSYEPLPGSPDDKFKVALDSEVFPLLRMNGDGCVNMSDVVIKEMATGDTSEKLLVVTDLALYYFPSKDFSRVTRRIDLKNIRSLMYFEPEGYILVQVQHDKSGKGDLLFRPASYRRDAPGIFKTFLEQLPKLALACSRGRRSLPTSQAKFKAKLFTEGRLDRRDAMAKMHSGARKMGMKKNVKFATSKMRKAAKKFGAIYHVGEDVVRGVAGGVGSLYDMAAMMVVTPGTGIHPSLQHAAEAVRIGLDKLTGSRGNAVFSALREQALKEVERESRARVDDTGSVSAHVRQTTRFYEEADIPDKDHVFYACACLNLVTNEPVVVVVTTSCILLYTDTSGGEGRPILARKQRLQHSKIHQLCYIVDCAARPTDFLMSFHSPDKEKDCDYLLQCKTNHLYLLKCYCLRRHNKLKKKDESARLQIGSVDNPDSLKILMRKNPGDTAPLPSLVPHVDLIHFATCEKGVELLSAYSETEMMFSGVADVQLYRGKTAEGGRSFESKTCFVAVTECALYLLAGPKELAIVKRVDLPEVTALLVNDEQNEEVIVQTMHYTLTARQAVPEGGVLNSPVSEHEATRLLEEAFCLPQCVDIMSMSKEKVVFRIWPVSAQVVRHMKNRLYKAGDMLSRTLFQGSKVELQDAVVTDDVLMKFDTGSEDFHNQLLRARVHWTFFERPESAPCHGDPTLVDIQTHFVKCPDKHKKAGEHALAGFAKTPQDAEAAARLLPPAVVRERRARWVRRRLAMALEDKAPDLLHYELKKGQVLGLVAKADRREYLLHARSLSSSAQHQRRVLQQLQNCIAYEKFREFDKLATRSVTALNPAVLPYCNKAFRAVMEWYRKPGKEVVSAYVDGLDVYQARMTIEEAKMRCLESSDCVGFTHEGGHDDLTKERLITFKTSSLNEQALKATTRMAGINRRAGVSPAQTPSAKTLSLAVPGVCLGLVPNQDNLANVMNSTTWLKGVNKLSALRQQRAQAEAQLKVLAEIGDMIPTMAEETPRKLDVDHMELSIMRARQQMKDKETNDSSRIAADMLATTLLVLTASMQRESIRRACDDTDDPVAARARALAWQTLCHTEDDEEMVEAMDHMKYLASSVWNAQVDMELMCLRDADQNEREAVGFYLDELLDDFEEMAAENDLEYNDALLESAVKHRWLTDVNPSDDEEVTARLQDLEAEVFQECIWRKRIERAVAEDDEFLLKDIEEDAAEDDAQPPPLELLEDAREELAHSKERGAARHRVQNVLQSAVQLFNGVRGASEDELAEHLGSIDGVLPQAEAFRSLAAERLSLLFLRTRLEAHRRRKQLARERAEAEDKRREADEAAARDRAEQLQRRSDDEEVVRQRKEKAAAEKVYAKAARMQAVLDETAKQIIIDGSTKLRRRNECCAALADARALAQTNTHEKLAAAVELLEEVSTKWDALLIGKEEQERKRLDAEIDAVIASKDRATYYQFVKAHMDALPTDVLCRIRCAWGALQTQEQDKEECEQKMLEAIKDRDKFALEEIMERAKALGFAEDNATAVKARDLLFELAGSLSPTRKPDGAEGVQGDSGGDEKEETASGNNQGKDAASQASSYVDSSDDEPSPRRQSNALPGFGGSPISGLGAAVEDAAVPASPSAASSSLGSPAAADAGDKSPSPQPPAEPEMPPPPPGSDVLKGLYSALKGLEGSSEKDAFGLVRCLLNNPWVKTYVDAWKLVIKFKLKKTGPIYKKRERHEMDVFEAVMGEAWSVRQAMTNFEIARKMNHGVVAGTTQDTFFLQYLMQSGRFFLVIQDTLTSQEDLRMKLYEKSACFVHKESVGYLMEHLLKAVKKLRFDFRFKLSNEDQLYLPPPTASKSPVPEAKAGGKDAEGAGAAAEDDESCANGGAAEKEEDAEDSTRLSEKPSAEQDEWVEVKEEVKQEAKEEADEAVDVMTLVAQSGEFGKMGEMGKLKVSVQQLLTYVDGMRRKLGVKKGSRLKVIFDESKNATLGVLARERLYPAVIALMHHGFKETAFKKRHLWQFIEATAAKRKTSEMSLGSLKLPEGIDTVKSVIDMKVGKIEGSGPAASTVYDLKLRALISFALNRGHLKIYLETLYEVDSLGGEDGKEKKLCGHMKEWFHSSALLLNPATRQEVDGILESLDCLPFHLLLDANVW